MKILEIKNITKTFKKTKVLSDFSLDVNEGEVISIVGPSGVGKSTLLRIINMLETLDSGEITVCGKDMIKEYKNRKPIYNNKNILDAINLSIGMVFQDFNLFPHLSVIKNITIGLTNVLKIPQEEADNKAMDLLEKMKLVEKAENYPFELSGGQKQRVAIARTLAINPKIICFDEPTSSLDAGATGEVIKVINKLKQEKITIIVVTHEPEFAQAISNRVIELR